MQFCNNCGLEEQQLCVCKMDFCNCNACINFYYERQIWALPDNERNLASIGLKLDRGAIHEYRLRFQKVNLKNGINS